MNGGQCSSNNHCLCPPEFTGRFCQFPAVPGGSGSQSQGEVMETEGIEPSSGKHAVYAVQVITGDDDPEGRGVKISQSALTVPLGPGHSSAEGILHNNNNYNASMFLYVTSIVCLFLLFLDLLKP